MELVADAGPPPWRSEPFRPAPLRLQASGACCQRRQMDGKLARAAGGGGRRLARPGSPRAGG
eukprot:2775331-Alexandrium_andersonii.AAC.1